MLSIKDFNGTNLSDNPPAAASYYVVGLEQATVIVQARVIEDDPYLFQDYVNGTLNWNDGSLPTVYDVTSGTLSVSGTASLPAGDYIISLDGRNYRAPDHDQVRVNFPVNVIQQETFAAPQRLIYGPILPRDDGDPGPSTWNFNTDSDLLILQSSVKMLLLTAKGERICEPEYGTDIRRLLFDPNVSGLENQIQEEIVRALTTWEPRLELRKASIHKDDPRSVTVDCVFLSKKNMQSFDINLRYVI